MRSRDRMCAHSAPALCARKEVQLGSGAIHEFRGGLVCAYVPVLSPVQALMRATVARPCACGVCSTPSSINIPSSVRFPKKGKKNKKKEEKAGTFLSLAGFFAKSPGAYTVLHASAAKCHAGLRAEHPNVD